jgi:hypothetical protein
MKVAFASVKPGKRVVGAVVLGELQFVRRGDDIIACGIIVVSVPAATGVLGMALWRIPWCCAAVTPVGGEKCLRQIDPLDGQRKRVLLGSPVTRGLLQRRHLCLHRVDKVQLVLHGSQALIHGGQLLEDGCEHVVTLAT